MEHALEVLQFQEIRTRLAAQCQSEISVAWAHDLLPEFDPVAVTRLKQETQEADNFLNSEPFPSASGLSDVRRPIQAAGKGANLDAQTLHSVGVALHTIHSMRGAIRRDPHYPMLFAYSQHIPELEVLEERLIRSVDADGEVLDAASTELAKLRRSKRNAAAKLMEKVNSYTTGAHRDYLSDPIVTQRAGRYVIPVKSEHRGKIKGVVHDSSASGQTVYLEPLDVIDSGNALRQAEAAELAEIARILKDLSERVGNHADEILAGIEAAAELDFIFARARLGHLMNASLPESGPDGSAEIESGVHPLLDPKTAVPLTIRLGLEGVDVLMITGPNTGGKTVAMKCVGLFVLMAQCGLMIPARVAKLGHFSQVWADIGDEQSMEQSLSTFGAHIKNIAEAIRGVQKGALVLLDEIGAGTDPAEGAALAKAILREFQACGARVIASTHYGELKLFSSNQPGFLNCSMEFDLKSLKPTYRLLWGSPGSSHALKIAERYGLPRGVIENAKDSSEAGEVELNQMIEQLEQAQKRAQKAQSEADRLTHRVREVESRAEQKLEEAEERTRTAKQRAAEAVDEELRRIRLEAQDLFEQLKGRQVNNDAARTQLKSLNQRGENLSQKLKTPSVPAAPQELKAGDVVKIRGYSQTGVLLESPKSGQARLQVGSLKMSVKVTDLERIETAIPAPKREARKSLNLDRAMNAAPEISLRGMRAEIAEELLEKFIDESVLAGFSSIRIVHGKGEGILKEMTAKMLKRHRSIRKFGEANAEAGGAGVTVAELS